MAGHKIDRRIPREAAGDSVEKNAVGRENRGSPKTPSRKENAEIKKEDHIPERQDLAKPHGGKFNRGRS